VCITQSPDLRAINKRNTDGCCQESLEKRVANNGYPEFGEASKLRGAGDAIRVHPVLHLSPNLHALPRGRKPLVLPNLFEIKSLLNLSRTVNFRRRAQNEETTCSALDLQFSHGPGKSKVLQCIGRNVLDTTRERRIHVRVDHSFPV